MICRHHPTYLAAVRAAAILLAACASCSRSAEESPPAGAPVTVVLKHQPLWGDPAPFHAFLDRFRRESPDVKVRAETLPNASAAACCATRPKANEAMTPGLPEAGVASSVTSEAEWGSADCPLKPSARQNGSS